MFDQNFSIPSGVTTEESGGCAGRKNKCCKSNSHSNMSGEPCDLDSSPLIVETISNISQKSNNISTKEN